MMFYRYRKPPIAACRSLIAMMLIAIAALNVCCVGIHSARAQSSNPIELSPPRVSSPASNPITIPPPKLVSPTVVEPIRPPARADAEVVSPPPRGAVSTIIPPARSVEFKSSPSLTGTLVSAPSATQQPVRTNATPAAISLTPPSTAQIQLSPSQTFAPTIVPSPTRSSQAANTQPGNTQLGNTQQPNALPGTLQSIAAPTAQPQFTPRLTAPLQTSSSQPSSSQPSSTQAAQRQSANLTPARNPAITIESPAIPTTSLSTATLRAIAPVPMASQPTSAAPMPSPAATTALVIENTVDNAANNRNTVYQPRVIEVAQLPASSRRPQLQQIPPPDGPMPNSAMNASRLSPAQPLYVAQQTAVSPAQPVPQPVPQPAAPLSIDQIPANLFPNFAPVQPLNSTPAAQDTSDYGGAQSRLPQLSQAPSTIIEPPVVPGPPANNMTGVQPEEYAVPPAKVSIPLEFAGPQSTNEPMWQFNFQNAPWSVVIRNFARQNSLALQMLQEPTGVFTFVDERPYTSAEALDLLNDYLLAEGFLLVRNNQKLTTISAGIQPQEGIIPFVALRQIETLGRNELASVAIPIKSNDAARVMAEIQPLLSRLGRAQIVSNSSRLIVTDTGAYLRRTRDILGGYGLAASDVQTTVFHLRNTTAEGVAGTISQHLGLGLPGGGGDAAAAGVQVASFSQPLSSTRVIPDKETNSLVISGTPAEVAEIQSLVCELDQARAQVLLQCLILEVNLGNVRELGAEIGLQDSVLFNRSVVDNLVTLQQTNTSPNGVQTTNQQIISQTSSPGFNFNGQPLGNNTSVSPTTIGTQGLANLGVGRTNAALGFGGLVLSAGSNSVNLLLRALQANYEVDVLSRPQIRTVDDKEAFIQIGQQVPVVDGVTVTAVGTANPIIRQDQAGIILKMTPHVSPDGLIQIKVSAEKSAFKLSPGTGVPIFTDARNGTVIQAPIKDISTAQATVSSRAGQTIVLGGMITRDEETIERRVPGLSRIPLIGRLFRYDYNNVTRKELLIFLTPQLITDDVTSDMIKDTEIGRIHAPLERATEIHGDLITGRPEEVIIEQPK